MTQNEKVLRYLRDKGTITPLEAYREFGIMRLASRIADLKKKGYPIERTMIAVENRYGEKVSFAEYHLLESDWTELD